MTVESGWDTAAEAGRQRDTVEKVASCQSTGCAWVMTDNSQRPTREYACQRLLPHEGVKHGACFCPGQLTQVPAACGDIIQGWRHGLHMLGELGLLRECGMIVGCMQVKSQ